MVVPENVRAASGKAADDELQISYSPQHSENVAFLQQPKQKIVVDSNLTICNPPERLRKQIVRDNTFPNPEIEAAEKYGRYTGEIAEEIKTFYCRGNDLVVQRGYGSDLIGILKRNDIAPEIVEERVCPPSSFPPLNGVTLRAYQKRAVTEAVEKNSQGILVAPTGAGKSIMGLEIIRRKSTPALILVHRSELAQQWQKEIKRLFGITPGFIGSGSWEVGDQITVALVQTLSRNEEKCREMGDQIGLILCDECHHAPARSFSEVIGWFPSKFRFGLSATPIRRDKLDCLIHRAIGPILAKIERDEVEAVNSIVPANITVIRTGFDPGRLDSWTDYISSLDNPQRNHFVIGLIPEDKSTLLLVDRIAHAERLSEMLNEIGVQHVMAHGSISREERTTLMGRVRKARITVATTSLIGEGIDVSHWETLIIASPISSEVKLLQAIGRVLRPSEGKELGSVFDLIDNCGFSGASLKNRMSIYRKHNIKFEFDNEPTGK
jgi:superfamily II DNA or RNA helicase